MKKLLIVFLTIVMGCSNGNSLVNDSLPLGDQLQQALDFATEEVRLNDHKFSEFKSIVLKLLPNTGFFEEKSWVIEQMDSFDKNFSNYIFSCTLIEKNKESVFHKNGIATIWIEYCKRDHNSNLFMQKNDGLFKKYKSQIWPESDLSCMYAVQVNFIKLKSMLTYYRDPKYNEKYFSQGQDLNRKILQAIKLDVLEMVSEYE